MVYLNKQPVTMAMMANEPGVADMILLDPVTEDQLLKNLEIRFKQSKIYVSCLLYTSPSPRDKRQSRMPSSA